MIWCERRGCANQALQQCELCPKLGLPQHFGKYCSKECQFSSYEEHKLFHKTLEVANRASQQSYLVIVETIAVTLKDAALRGLLPALINNDTFSLLLVGCTDAVEGMINFTHLYDLMIGMSVYPPNTLQSLEVTLCGPELINRAPHVYPGGRCTVIRMPGRVHRLFPPTTVHHAPSIIAATATATNGYDPTYFTSSGFTKNNESGGSYEYGYNSGYFGCSDPSTTGSAAAGNVTEEYYKWIASQKQQSDNYYNTGSVPQQSSSFFHAAAAAAAAGAPRVPVTTKPPLATTPGQGSYSQVQAHTLKPTSHFHATVDRVAQSHYSFSFNAYNGAPAIASTSAMADLFSCVILRHPGFQPPPPPLPPFSSFATPPGGAGTVSNTDAGAEAGAGAGREVQVSNAQQTQSRQASASLHRNNQAAFEKQQQKWRQLKPWLPNTTHLYDRYVFDDTRPVISGHHSTYTAALLASQASAKLKPYTGNARAKVSFSAMASSPPAWPPKTPDIGNSPLLNRSRSGSGSGSAKPKKFAAFSSSAASKNNHSLSATTAGAASDNECGFEADGEKEEVEEEEEAYRVSLLDQWAPTIRTLMESGLLVISTGHSEFLNSHVPIPAAANDVPAISPRAETTSQHHWYTAPNGTLPAGGSSTSANISASARTKAALQADVLLNHAMENLFPRSPSMMQASQRKSIQGTDRNISISGSPSAAGAGSGTGRGSVAAAANVDVDVELPGSLLQDILTPSTVVDELVLGLQFRAQIVVPRTLNPIRPSPAALDPYHTAVLVAKNPNDERLLLRTNKPPAKPDTFYLMFRGGKSEAVNQQMSFLQFMSDHQHDDSLRETSEHLLREIGCGRIVLPEDFPLVEVEKQVYLLENQKKLDRKQLALKQQYQQQKQKQYSEAGASGGLFPPMKVFTRK
jgi:hypothetical protein